MGRLPVYTQTCRAPHPDPHRAARGEVHGVEIGSSTIPMRPTGRLLNWLQELQVGGRRRYAPSCGKCGVATEYEECTVEEADAA